MRNVMRFSNGPHGDQCVVGSREIVTGDNNKDQWLFINV